VSETTAVSPIDGTIMRGGERNTGTGREPWRCPILKVLEPDGTLRYQLYEWPSRYVGMDFSRQVSDTAVRGVAFDHEGNLLVKLWSDGGNSVALSQPTDIRRGPPNSGLGLNAAGAHATSFTYLVKLEPKNYQILGWTMWTSKYKGRANGAGVDALSYSEDGSVLFAGGTAWGMIQTTNKLANGEPAGDFIAVMTPDMTGMRFCSAVPGLGAAHLGNDRDRIAIGHGLVQGKPRALFVGGAKAEEEVYGLVTRTPTLNPVQAAFGGGESDGYVVMVDLAAGTPVVKPPTPPRPLQRLLITNEGTVVGRKSDPPKGREPTSTAFAFTSDTPKWHHAEAEFRVADGSYWPNFVAGRSENGAVTWSESGLTGAYAVAFDLWAQDKGKQDRRVLGQLYAGGEPPKFSFSVPSFGTQASEEGTSVDGKGVEVKRTVACQPVDATLTLGAVTAKIPFKVVGKRGRVVESEMQRLNVVAYATVKGSVLGLKGDLAGKEIDIRITAPGHRSRNGAAGEVGQEALTRWATLCGAPTPSGSSGVGSSSSHDVGAMHPLFCKGATGMALERRATGRGALPSIRIHTPARLRVERIVSSPFHRLGVHRHPFHELVFLLQGEYEARHEGGVVRLRPGQGAYYPAGCAHRPAFPCNYDCHVWLVQWWRPSLRLREPRAITDQHGLVGGVLEWLCGELRSPTARSSHRIPLLSGVLFEWIVRGDQPAAQTRMDRVRAYLGADNQLFPTVENLAKIARISRHQLRRDFQKALGTSPRSEIKRLRLERARALLLRTDLSIKEISERVGYSHPQQLSTNVRHAYGCTAKQLRSRGAGSGAVAPA
jgi:AraC-like DNA-binding protein